MIVISTILSGDNKNHAKAYWYVCEKTDECPLFKKGKCACFRYILGRDLVCPNAGFRFATGPTKRAGSHSAWVSEMKTTLKAEAEAFNQKLSEVAGYIFCPMPHLTTLSGNDVNGVISEHFIRVEDFTADKVEEIVQHKPRAFFNNAVIKDYPEKEVPKFISQLREEFPDIYEEWKAKYPDSAKQFENMTMAGRTAYISTLPDGYIGKGFHKEGDCLVNEEYKSVLFDGGFNSKQPLYVKVKIEDDMTVKVTEKTVTDEATKYVD